MSTTKPRITITLNEADYAVLKRLNALNGVPMSKTVKELVELVAPVLVRVCDNLEKVKIADENIKNRLLRSAEKSLETMEEIYSIALDNVDMFTEDLERAIAEQNAIDGKVPPSSNTGVRSSTMGVRSSKLAGSGG